MKNIIITGYPKSGNTWVTKLIAELVGCPSKGFYGAEHSDFSKEGEERDSEYACYKSHSEYETLIADEDIDYIICVIRDPRDIVVSGAHYFRRVWAVRSKRWKNSLAGRILNRIHWEAFGRNKMLEEMSLAVGEGNNWIHLWCSVSWRDHSEPFVDDRSDKVLYVKYEDLKQDASKVCRSILKLIELERTASEISTAIERHSFQNLKEKYSEGNQKREVGFLRKGVAGEWKSMLSKSQVETVQKGAGLLMERLGYT